MTCPWCGEDIEVPDDDRASMGYPSQSGAVCCSWDCSEAMDAPRQPDPADDPPEDDSPTTEPLPHQE